MVDMKSDKARNVRRKVRGSALLALAGLNATVLSDAMKGVPLKSRTGVLGSLAGLGSLYLAGRGGYLIGTKPEELKKQSSLKEIYDNAFNDELEKIALPKYRKLGLQGYASRSDGAHTFKSIKKGMKEKPMDNRGKELDQSLLKKLQKEKNLIRNPAKKEAVRKKLTHAIRT